ncbi:MAG TPA: hypothetical protein VMI75_23435 [Polyangiaceae bacterium]|nr:hypothetical protein [Polyangiaceae bacterium]
MRKSTVLFVLVSIVCATAAGCSPYADRGPASFAPRVYAFIPNVQLTPGTTQPDEPPTSNAERAP